MATAQDILAQADRLDDKEELIYSAERLLHRKVFEAASDLCNALSNDEFAELCGGKEKLEKDLGQAVFALEKWFSDAEPDTY